VAKIDELSFGSIVIEGRRYRRDVLIFVDDTVKKRKGGFLAYDALAKLNGLTEQKKKVAALIHMTRQGIEFMSI
jgi:hypothetical protein